MYLNAASAFYEGWNGTPPPIRTIYLVTWTRESRNEFEAYRDQVESRGNFIAMGKYAGNERKRFRGAERACTIGEDGNVTMCYNGDCKVYARPGPYSQFNTDERVVYTSRAMRPAYLIIY
ncbi:hypothetical protein LRP88_03723 [Fusarium phalaenopsidis]